MIDRSSAFLPFRTPTAEMPFPAGGHRQSRRYSRLDDSGRTADASGVNYPGSKGGSGVWQAIISAMPPHTTFIEPFLGTGTITRYKLPARSTIGIDADTAAPGFELCKGIPGFTGICADGIHCLESREWKGDELVYADPPYLMSTRSWKGGYYRKEFDTPKQHRQLLSVLKGLPVPVILSGYHSPLYAEALKTWRTIEIPTVNRRGQRVTEWLWLNFPEPFELHDYRFLGRDFRQRQDIKRKMCRWRNKLQRMSPLERAAILQAVNQYRAASSGVTISR